MPGDFNEFAAFDDPIFASEMKKPKQAQTMMGKSPKKIAPKLPEDNFLKKYEKYAHCKELYVFTTIHKDITK